MSITPELTKYIEETRQMGISDEVIRQELLKVGWNSMDIDNALTPVAPIMTPAIKVATPAIDNKPAITTEFRLRQEKPQATVVQSVPENHGKKILPIVLIALLILIIGGAGVFAYFYFVKSSKQQSPAETNQITQQVQPAPAQPTVSVNPDVERVKTILEDMRQGYLTGSSTMIVKYASAETAAIMAYGKIETVSGFSVNSITQSGTNIVANFTATSTSEKPDTQNVVFIKEGDDWKFDLNATAKWEQDQAEAKAITDDPNGLPDLIVTGATVYPSHPIVNDKEVEISVIIKNIGTKTSDGGAPLEASLLGFTKEVPVQGGSLVPLTPGKSVMWSFKPYERNTFFKISDTPGQKSIQIVLNKDKKITESNYSNNTFTQTVQIYSN